jgi:hypothetical protein
MKFLIITIILMLTMSIFSQAFQYGENLFNKPHHNETAIKALNKMQSCIKIWYFKDKKIYENTLSPIYDENSNNYSDFIQIKLSENSILVIYISKMRRFNGNIEEPSNLVGVTSFFVKYGEMDKTTIKYCWIEKKRIYPKNNEFTEEIRLSKNLYFIITERQFLQSLVINDTKVIPLTNTGADFCK